MTYSKLQIFENNAWTDYEICNEVSFDERVDGQLRSATCYIKSNVKLTYAPQRKAKLVFSNENAEIKSLSYYAYFNGQKRGANYWIYQVSLIDPAKRLQGEMINGLRIVQGTETSYTIYDILQRLYRTTPLRGTDEETFYTIALTGKALVVAQKKVSPEYSWSCRTTFWECLKEIGQDMGGFIPDVTFDENAKLKIDYRQSDEIVNTITDFDYISYSEEVDPTSVCSAIDTDIANVIATNQGTSSISFPSQNSWITPRTEDVQLTTDNCEIQCPSIIEKPIKVLINGENISFNLISVVGTDISRASKTLEELTGDTQLDVTSFFPEKKKYDSLETVTQEITSELTKNNCCYWTESGKTFYIISRDYVFDINRKFPAYINLIYSAFVKKYGNKFNFNNREYTIDRVKTPSDPRDFLFRVEYVPRDTTTKIVAVKQERQPYEYTTPYNQRAEIVDANSLGQEMDKNVNQIGVESIKAVSLYKDFLEVLPIGTVYQQGNDNFLLTANEYSITGKTSFKVTHIFAKNWAMQSEYLKQNKAYRNTNIPTDILVRNLHYQDYIVISENILTDTPKGSLSKKGMDYFSRVFADRIPGEITEINNCTYLQNLLIEYLGVVLSVSSFGVKKSLVFSAKVQNNLTAGKYLGDDNFCQEALYTDENGTFTFGQLRIQLGHLSENTVDSKLLPLSTLIELIVPMGTNALQDVIFDKVFQVDKSSAEHTNFTYQVHIVSDMVDLVIGGLIADNNPLVLDLTEDLKYQLWGLNYTVGKMETVIDDTKAVKIADITNANKSTYFTVTVAADGSYMALNLLLAGKLAGYKGYAITDENGKLYFARNSKANENQTLYFNNKHVYHKQD